VCGESPNALKLQRGLLASLISFEASLGQANTDLIAVDWTYQKKGGWVLLFCRLINAT